MEITLWDNIYYVFLLLADIAIGPCIRKINSKSAQQTASAVMGFLLVWMASGWHTLHPLILVTINCWIVLLTSKRLCHILSFIFCFSYLTIVRIGYFLGLPSPLPCGNAVLMFMTLKMVGLAFEVHDSHMRRSTDNEKSLEEEYLSIDPSAMDVFRYGFCHAGVLVGPYFKYRTYWDGFHADFSTSTDGILHALSRVKFVPLYGLMYLILDYGYPAKYAVSEEIYASSHWYRLWYMTPTTLVYRLRLYIGFILAECQCMTAGIGAYPVECHSRSGQGPTLLQNLNKEKKSANKVDFETIHNVNVYQSEFASTTKELGWNWNITVQYWLYAYVYKRLPLSWKRYRSPLTMLMSALWHGIHPAYYLWAVTISFMFLTEDALIRTFSNDAFPGGKKAFNWLIWCFRTQMMYYNGMSFVLLDTKDILLYWSSVYFLGHLILFIVYIVSSRIYSYQEKYSQLKRSS